MYFVYCVNAFWLLCIHFCFGGFHMSVLSYSFSYSHVSGLEVECILWETFSVAAHILYNLDFPKQHLYIKERFCITIYE